MNSTNSQGTGEIIPGVEEPFLKTPRKAGLSYTLIFDLDETLIYYPDDQLHDMSNVETKIKIRPYAYEFLRAIREYYEIVVFTAAS